MFVELSKLTDYLSSSINKNIETDFVNIPKEYNFFQVKVGIG